MTDYCKDKIKNMILAMTDEEIETVIEALEERMYGGDENEH